LKEGQAHLNELVAILKYLQLLFEGGLTHAHDTIELHQAILLSPHQLLLLLDLNTGDERRR